MCDSNFDEVLGIVTFIASSSIYWFLSRDNSSGATLTTENLVSKKGSNIKRNFSEYSLGLSRSLSVNRDLSTLGPLCDSGQVFLQVTNYSLRAAIGAAIAYGIYTEIKRK
jgi:hypothetical protein